MDGMAYTTFTLKMSYLRKHINEVTYHQNGWSILRTQWPSHTSNPDKLNQLGHYITVGSTQDTIAFTAS